MSYVFDKGVTVGKFAKFVAPSVLMLVIISFYYLIDSIFVARYAGGNALASMNIVYPVAGLGWGISVMIAAGSSALVAISMGEGKLHLARQRFTLICIVSLVLGVALAVVGIMFLDPIVNVLGATNMLKSDSTAYGFIMILSSPVAFLSVLFEYFIRVDGKPGFTLFLYVSGGVVHILLDVLFMVIWDWGIEGAGWATLIGQATIVIIGVGYFIVNQKKKTAQLKFVKPQFEGRYIAHTFINGSSEMVSESSVAITTFLYNSLMISLIGEVGVTALTIVQNSHYLLISIHLGFITGVAPLISYYYGAKEYDKMNKFLSYSKNFLIASSIGTALLCFLFSHFIAGVFVDPGSEAFVLASNGIKIISVAFLFTGINVFASGFFTAYGNGLISATISFSRGLVMVIIGMLILPRLLGVTGVWLIIVFTEVSTLGVSIAMFKKYQKKYKYKFFNPGTQKDI